MLEGFRKRRRNRQIVDDLYTALVEQSRGEVLFTACGLPDTVMGRFESLSAHVFLFLARCRDEAELKPLAQDLVDRFMSDIEDSIREIGIGDVTVPKRMRKLAGMFYERVDAYDAPLAARDEAALALALARFALPPDAEAQAAGRLARHMIAAKAEWDVLASRDILRGRLAPENGKDHV